MRLERAARKEENIVLQRLRFILLALVLLAALAAHTASSQTLLFHGNYDQLRPLPRVVDVIPPSSFGTLVTVPGTPVGFTVPSRLFSEMFSFK